jgi:hypothetical protein
MGGVASGTCAVENLTPHPIEMAGSQGARLLLAPFERRVIDTAFSARFDWEVAGRDSEVRRTREPVVDLERKRSGLVILVIVGIVAAVAGVSVVVQVAIWLAVALLVAWMLICLRRRRSEAWLWTREMASLLTVVLIGLGIPSAAIWLGTDLPEAAWSAWEHQTGLQGWEIPNPAVIGRALQWLFIVTAALVPALLYYLFDRQQLRTLHDRFVQHVFRLDGTLSTLCDLEARYGAQIEETYGSDQHRRAGARLSGGRRFPVVLASTLLTLGWTAALLRPELTSGTASSGSDTLVQLFRPERSVVTFAFLGAYVFTLEVVVRGYLRGDLRPKTYTRIAVRLLTVVALAFVLDTMAGTTSTAAWLVAAFVAGVFPDWGLQIILERVREFSLGKSPAPSMRAGTPLTELEEVDVFDRSTLGDEGVTNIEALAHHDLIALMLQTRIPAPRLIDWTDQAILRLYAGAGGLEDGDLFSRIRPLGLRTATQLLTVYEAAESRKGQRNLDCRLSWASDATRARACPATARSCSHATEARYDRATLHRLLGIDSKARPSPLDTLVAAMRSEEWLEAIEQWRCTGPRPDRPTIHLDANAPVRRRPETPEVPGDLDPAMPASRKTPATNVSGNGWSGDERGAVRQRA